MDILQYFFTNKSDLPANLPGRLFSPLHIVVMIILIIGVPLLAFFLRKMEKRKIKILFTILWVVITVLEIVKIIWESSTNPNGFEVTGILPLYICSIFMYIMPFVIWAKEGSFFHRMGCSYICTTNLIGGLVNFVYPANVLSNYSCLSFAGMHTLFYHGTMVFVALLMLFSRYYSFKNIKDFILAFIPLLVISIPANIINFTYKASYMFFRGGFPFSLISDHMPAWLWVIVLYAAYAIIPILFYLPNYIVQKRKQKKLHKQQTI